MATAKGGPVTSVTSATTALNSLAAGAWTDQLTEYDNSTGLYLYGWFELLLGADLTAAANGFVGCYLIPAPDGTNYPNPPSTTGAAPISYWVANITANSSSATFRRGVSPVFPLPFTKFKPKLYHGLHGSTAFNSTGNTLTLYLAYEQSS